MKNISIPIVFQFFRHLDYVRAVECNVHESTMWILVSVVYLEIGVLLTAVVVSKLQAYSLNGNTKKTARTRLLYPKRGVGVVQS